jgi:hypothetical protein
LRAVPGLLEIIKMSDDNGFTAHSLALLVLLQEYCRGLFLDGGAADESQVRQKAQTHAAPVTRTLSAHVPEIELILGSNRLGIAPLS